MSPAYFRLFAAVLVVHLGSSAAFAETLEESEALGWLERIAGAARDLNYTGTFIYQYGERVETSRITHYVDSGGEYEKLETLDGPKREIIRTNDEVITYLADEHVVRREARVPRRSFPALLPEQLAALTAHYQLRKLGLERVAGYEAQALLLEPRDEFRYGHKLWAELKSGLLLKARMLNEQHHIIEQFHFTQVDVNARLTRDSVRPSFPIPVAPRAGNGKPSVAMVDTGWTVRDQPAGFTKIMEMRRSRFGGEGQVSHLVYSDGLAAVSVFIEPIPPGRKVVEGLASQGAVNIYTKALDGQLITVLGETPAVTVRRIGDSVTPK